MAARKQANRRGQGGVPPLVWVLGGLLIGLLIMGLLFLRGGKDGDFVLPTPNPDAKPAVALADDSAAPDDPVEAEEPAKTEFAFYDMLTEQEVAIPDAELSARAQAEAAQAAAQQDANAATDPAADNPASPDAPVANTAQDEDQPAAVAERYLLQAGAFRELAQAEDLKARIALSGEIARIEPAEINGATVYRVRLGPYSNATSLAAAKTALAKQGLSVQAIRAR